MSDTVTDTFNPDDRRRVFAAFAADYRIVADWTGLRSRGSVDVAVAQIKNFIEKEYLAEIHIRLKDSDGKVRRAAVYRVSTEASAWSDSPPGDLYWDHEAGDNLNVHIVYSEVWWALSPGARETFRETHIPNWGTADISGDYDLMSASEDRKYSSGAYGMRRTSYSR
jgi:hypothetical protein